MDLKEFDMDMFDEEAEVEEMTKREIAEVLAEAIFNDDHIIAFCPIDGFENLVMVQIENGDVPNFMYNLDKMKPAFVFTAREAREMTEDMMDIANGVVLN